MKALFLTDQTDNHLRIGDIDKPEPAKGEALIKIKASALNHRDQWMREGKYPGIRYETILGSDASGIVEKVNGEGAEWEGRHVVINPNIGWGEDPSVQKSDYSILGMPVNGTMAEYVSVPVDRLKEIPSHLNFSQAASLPLAGLTAYRALFTHGKLQKGQHVLINGIGGGVAQMAFMFAKAAGATVSVTSGTQEKLDLMKKKGAAGTYNYKEDNWAKSALKEQGGFHLCIDSAGGEGLNNLVKCTRPGGRIVFYGATTGMPKNLDLFRLFWNQITLQGSTMGNDQEFSDMIDFVADHKLVPEVDSVRPLAEAEEAFDAMKNFSQTGKLVLEMNA
ncbi:zinc-binding alcohol dehydrogenase family protein [Roseivirga sp. BDSF3-8]|uniref:quinone oxidoreductase family protein n=1 Tax=Roseivirga sp. BDSF3-8 TaxID=3241598 RepID=UPI0035324FFB